MTDFPDVKLKALVTFPGTINGGTGLTATKGNGSITLDFAWQEFGSISAIPTSPTSFILTYDTTTDAYVMVPSHLLGGAASGIADAPVDGLAYARQSGAWTQSPNFTNASLLGVPTTPTAAPGTNTTQVASTAFVAAAVGVSTAKPYVIVTDYPGVDKTGAADSTAGMQAAHNTGRMVFYPAGTYKFTNLIISSGGLIGEGIGQTVLSHSLTNSSFAIVYNGSGASGVNAPRFENFRMLTNPKPGGGAISIVPAGTTNLLWHPVVKNIYAVAFPYGVYIDKVVNLVMEGCYIVNSTIACVYISNTINGDMGDHSISNCFFGGGDNVRQVSGGGLKLTNSKLIGGTSGFTLGWSSPDSSADLLISNCSFENHTNAGIYLGRVSGTATFRYILITGNEIANQPNPIVTDSSGALVDLVITGNVVNPAGASQDGILISNINGFVISGNKCEGNGGAGNFGIHWVGSCQNGLITGNVTRAFATSVNAGTGSGTSAVVVNNNL